MRKGDLKSGSLFLLMPLAAVWRGNASYTLLCQRALTYFYIHAIINCEYLCVFRSFKTGYKSELLRLNAAFLSDASPIHSHTRNEWGMRLGNLRRGSVNRHLITDPIRIKGGDTGNIGVSHAGPMGPPACIQLEVFGLRKEIEQEGETIVLEGLSVAVVDYATNKALSLQGLVAPIESILRSLAVAISPLAGCVVSLRKELEVDTPSWTVRLDGSRVRIHLGEEGKQLICSVRSREQGVRILTDLLEQICEVTGDVITHGRVFTVFSPGTIQHMGIVSDALGGGMGQIVSLEGLGTDCNEMVPGGVRIVSIESFNLELNATYNVVANMGTPIDSRILTILVRIQRLGLAYQLLTINRVRGGGLRVIFD